MLASPREDKDQKLFIGKYQDYKRIHRNYINTYKKLHEDVAAFSVLPETFIQQAEPVIERFLEEHPAATSNHKQREQLQTITNFINAFHNFMDKATEMFRQHQSLSEDTSAYLQKVLELDGKYDASGISKLEQEYMHLVPELQGLLSRLKKVKATANSTSYNLRALTPLWESIKAKIA